MNPYWYPYYYGTQMRFEDIRTIINQARRIDDLKLELESNAREMGQLRHFLDEVIKERDKLKLELAEAKVNVSISNQLHDREFKEKYKKERDQAIIDRDKAISTSEYWKNKAIAAESVTSMDVADLQNSLAEANRDKGRLIDVHDVEIGRLTHELAEEKDKSRHLENDLLTAEENRNRLLKVLDRFAVLSEMGFY